MMVKGRMEEVTIFGVVLSLMIWVMECYPIEGRTLDPIYWNSSNTMLFRKDSTPSINVALYDKLDIICPRRGRNDKEKLFYFKLFLVTEDHFNNCSSATGRRLITCNVPEQEKKYTFYFQELSPSPWGLEFEPNKNYYVLSTSTGSPNGIDSRKGGACAEHHMKIVLRVHAKEDVESNNNNNNNNNHNSNNNVNNNHKNKDNNNNNNGNIPNPNRRPTPSVTVIRPNINNIKPVKNTKSTTNEVSVPTDANSNEVAPNNGLVIGIVLGACAVLFVVLIAFLGYKVYRRRRHMKKYQSPPMTPTRGATPLQQVTLLPIAPASHHGLHHHHHGRLHSESDRHRSATLSSHSDMRPPPSYNESFLDNGGPVVAV